jgi:hypothetical protein
MQCYDNVILTGTPADPGLMVLSLSQIFRERATYAQTEDEEFTVTASYLEVYNEVCRHPWPSVNVVLPACFIRGYASKTTVAITAEGKQTLMMMKWKASRHS